MSQIISLESVREIMFDILTVLHNHGIDTVSVGGIMRLLGVPSEIAADHDDEYLQVSVESFEEEDQDQDQEEDEELEVAPPGTTLH